MTALHCFSDPNRKLPAQLEAWIGYFDTGVPGMEGDILAGLEALGLSWSDVKRVVLTHHDLDHIGSLPAVVAASGAEVLALEAEAPYIQGDRPGQKTPTPEMVASCTRYQLDACGR